MCEMFGRLSCSGSNQSTKPPAAASSVATSLGHAVNEKPMLPLGNLATERKKKDVAARQQKNQRSAEEGGVGDEEKDADEKVEHVTLFDNVTKQNNVCPGCKKKFQSGSVLYRHIRGVHNNERKFPCNIESCSYSAKSSHDLIKHQKRHKAKAIRGAYKKKLPTLFIASP